MQRYISRRAQYTCTALWGEDIWPLCCSAHLHPVAALVPEAGALQQCKQLLPQQRQAVRRQPGCPVPVVLLA